MNARTFDLTPFHRATIGFDQLFNELDRTFANSVNQGYPPYNIIKLNEDNYQIELAVAGFSMNELSITVDKDQLIIEGHTNEHEDDITSYLHKGIANRNFIRTFKIAEHMEVTTADLELGILRITLERNIPEELQPKKIAITYKS
jgi:molecular chaperone IbpA